MVKGRRVRAVVACSRNDDCCSPNPKRKDQGKLAHAMLNVNKNQTITQFFQAVGVDIIDDSTDLLLKPEAEEMVGDEGRRTTDDDDDDILEDDATNDLDDRAKEEFTDIITTPNIKNSLIMKSFMEDMLSPPTPHRIELCLDDDDSGGAVVKQETVMQPPLAEPKKMPTTTSTTTKARRRLNNNQASNRQQQHQQQGGAAKVAAERNGNHKLTDFFPVRRSARKINKLVLEEKQRSLEQMLRKGTERGLRVKYFEGKGRGIVANKLFNRGDYVVEYAGDLIEISEARNREVKYAQDQNTGCYMYYFKHKGQQYCIDATPESNRLGRLVNHSRNGNLNTRTIDVDGKPRLVLIAKDTIEVGEEVTYDYGDRSKESLRYHPWLAY